MEELNFDEMRNQIAILKTKLDNQDIVNERMIRSIISTKAENMMRPILISILCALSVIVIGPLSFNKILGASWYFVIATDILMLYCIIREYLFKRQLNNNLMSESLLDVAKKMYSFKKAYKRYTITNMCILLPIWLTLLIAETLNNKHFEDSKIFIIGVIIGFTIGACLGLKMYFKIQNNASDIIKQIEE